MNITWGRSGGRRSSESQRVMVGSLGLLGCFLALNAAVPQSLPEKPIEEGHWKRARAIVEPWIREKPNDPLANFLLSQIRNAFHDRQSPLGLAENAVRLDSRVAKYHRQVAEVMGVTAQHSGMLQQLFLARRFKKELDTALSQGSNDLQALRDLTRRNWITSVIYLEGPKVGPSTRSTTAYVPISGMVNSVAPSCAL